jgi:hypothetical protein
MERGRVDGFEFEGDWRRTMSDSACPDREKPGQRRAELGDSPPFAMVPIIVLVLELVFVTS